MGPPTRLTRSPRRRTWISLGVLCAAVAVAALSLSSAAKTPYAPEQPIDFSHRVHVGDDQLDCAVCHSAARRSAFAGIAPLERCIGCHKYVATGHPEVLKLRRLWDARKTISWVKVYELPAFVRFNHEAHSLAQIPCDTCHGDVGSMHRVRRVVDLTMGWCVQCHRDRGAPDDCVICHH